MPLNFLKRQYQKKLIPTPALFWHGQRDPFEHTHEKEQSPLTDIYFATERQPSNNARFYNSKRDHVLHLGKASVQLGDEKTTWAQIVQASLKQKRNVDPMLSVKSVQEFGSLWTASAEDSHKEKEQQQSQSFAQDINQKLARSHTKDIYIFVPGFKVCFEDPLIVTKQFWHFLGYDGVFVAYAWPSTPGRLTSYAHDLETTKYCSRNFRLLLEFLAESTDAKRIHIIGHSAGSRIVCSALNELRLKYSHQNEEQVRKTLKISQVILLGADFDRMLLKSYFRDKILDLLENVTIYVSRRDIALKTAKLLFQSSRLGENSVKDLSSGALKVLREHQKIHGIDASLAKGSYDSSGHMYLLTSPWISSDMILVLKDNLKPKQRFLKSMDEGLYWSFDREFQKRERYQI